jgi:hypothetical protein
MGVSFQTDSSSIGTASGSVGSFFVGGAAEAVIGKQNCFAITEMINRSLDRIFHRDAFL